MQKAFYANHTLVRVAESDYRPVADDERLGDLGLALCDPPVVVAVGWARAGLDLSD